MYEAVFSRRARKAFLDLPKVQARRVMQSATSQRTLVPTARSSYSTPRLPSIDAELEVCEFSLTLMTNVGHRYSRYPQERRGDILVPAEVFPGFLCWARALASNLMWARRYG